MVANVMEIFIGEKALVVKVAQRWLDIEGVDPRESNQPRVSLNMTVGRLQVLFQNAFFAGRRW